MAQGNKMFKCGASYRDVQILIRKDIADLP